MAEDGTYNTAQIRTAERINSGKFNQDLKLFRVLLNKNQVQSRATTRILA